MGKFSYESDLARLCFDCAVRSGRVNNLYFAGNPVKTFFIRRNFNHVLSGLGYVAHRGKCLDFGPGMGIMLPALAREFKHVIAIDIDENQLNSANTLVSNCEIDNVEFILGKEENELGIFEDSAFDCIIADNVLEHIESTELIISEFYRILSDSGVLIVSLPSQNAIYRMFENKDDGHVLRTYSQIIDLIGKFRSHYSRFNEFDVFPFFKTFALTK
jgi:ubiquinone/menaquinone biosynthesis C-methylase UbiE